MARSRFHLSLARLGKTPLRKEEWDLLAEELYQARRRRNEPSNKLYGFPIPQTNQSGFGVPNKVFLFESNQGKYEYMYQELARFVGMDRDRFPPLKNNFRSSWTANSTAVNSTATNSMAAKSNYINICFPEFEFVRKELLPISYTLGRWLLDYFIPASLERDDITIPNVTAFQEIV